MQKLTSDEKIFLEKHHKLVYKFLHYYNLSIDEYYDIVIFGYIRAVKKYFYKEELKNYSFTTIAWKSMLSELSKNVEYNKRLKRNEINISLDICINEQEDVCLKDIIKQTNYNIDEIICNKDICDNILSVIDDDIRTIILLKYYGYNNKDIALKCSISESKLYKIMNKWKKSINSYKKNNLYII